jgi:ATP-dependent DNA ligase
MLEAESMALGVISKRRDASYRSGTHSGWVKLKTRAWRAAAGERGRLFSREDLRQLVFRRRMAVERFCLKPDR